MNSGHAGDAAGPLHTLFRIGAAGGLTDEHLLDRFARGGPAGEDAFEALVARHGPMVLRVCRATLGRSDDAQDAFQATFLVLARRAHAIRQRASIGGWLFGVATRVSARARVDAARRRSLERRAAALAETLQPAPEFDDLTPAIRQEVARLPAKYREAVVLCYLQGLTCTAAADRIGCPVGTVKIRLSRARDLLRTRLTRRGLALPAGLAAAGLATRTAAATTSLVPSAARLALTATASGRVAALTQGVLRTMVLNQFKLAGGVAMVAVGLLAAGIGAFGHPRRIDPPSTVPAAPPAPVASKPEDRATQRALRAASELDDPAERAEALLGLARAQLHRGETEAARATLGSAGEAAAAIAPTGRYTRPHPAIRVAEALAKAGARAEAHRMFGRALRQVREEPKDAGLADWISLIETQRAAEGGESVRDILDQYRDLKDRDLKAEGRTVRVFDGRAWVTALKGDIDEAMRRIREDPHLQGPGAAVIKIGLFLEMVRSLGPGDREAVRAILAEARRTLDSGDAGPAAAADLAAAFAESGSFAEALAILAAIAPPPAAIAPPPAANTPPPAANTPPPAANTPLPAPFSDEVPPPADPRAESDHVAEKKADGYLRVGMAQAKAGDRAGAREAALKSLALSSQLRNPDVSPQARAMAVLLLIRSGALDEARGVIATLPLPARLAALGDLAGYQARAGDEAAARATARDAIRLAEDGLRSLDARPIAEREEDFESTRDGVAAVIVRLEARHGDVEAARRAVGRVRDDGRKEAAWLSIPAGLAWRGDVEDASAFAETLGSPRLRARAAIRVASTLREWDEP